MAVEEDNMWCLDTAHNHASNHYTNKQDCLPVWFISIKYYSRPYVSSQYEHSIGLTL